VDAAVEHDRLAPARMCEAMRCQCFTALCAAGQVHKHLVCAAERWGLLVLQDHARAANLLACP
jgi:hypothetical protein